MTINRPLIESTPVVLNLFKCVNHTPVLTCPFALTQHLQVLIRQMDLATTSSCLVGRVAQFVHNWYLITQDLWVLGLANNNGLPVGTDAGALSNKTKPCNTVFFRGKTQNFPGGTGTSG